MAINLKSLIGKLNDTTRNALESAAGLCVARRHYDVEVEHFMLKLLDQTEGDFARIASHFGVDKSRLTGELNRSLDKLKTGNARTPAISPHVVRMMTEAWTTGSIDFNVGEVRTGFTILALTGTDDLRREIREVSKEFQKIDGDVLRKDFVKIVEGSEEEMAPVEAASAGAPGAPRPAGAGKTANLDQFTVNLTENAKAGKIDPVLGRDMEIHRSSTS